MVNKTLTFGRMLAIISFLLYFSISRSLIVSFTVLLCQHYFNLLTPVKLQMQYCSYQLTNVFLTSKSSQQTILSAWSGCLKVWVQTPAYIVHYWKQLAQELLVQDKIEVKFHQHTVVSSCHLGDWSDQVSSFHSMWFKFSGCYKSSTYDLSVHKKQYGSTVQFTT